MPVPHKAAPDKARSAASSPSTGKRESVPHHTDPEAAPGARPVVRRAPHREVGLVNAPWLLDHPVEHESHLERCFVYVALASPMVTTINHQPESINLRLPDGSERKYTPDFRVTLADRARVICEIKPAKFVKQDEAVHLEAANHYRSCGEHFMVVTDRQIHNNARSARAILLMRYGRLHFSAQQAEECKLLLEQEMAGSTHVQQLVARGVSEDLVWHMVAKHMLRTKVPLNVNPLETVEINDPMENCLDHFQRWFGHPDR